MPGLRRFRSLALNFPKFLFVGAQDRRAYLISKLGGDRETGIAVLTFAVLRTRYADERALCSFNNLDAVDGELTCDIHRGVGFGFAFGADGFYTHLKRQLYGLRSTVILFFGRGG